MFSGKLIYQRLILFVSIAIVLLMTGCGFYLRGFVPLPIVLAKPYLDGSDTALISRLADALQSRGAEPVTDKSVASVFIEFLEIRYQREVGTLDIRGVVTGYVLTYEILYRVVDSGGEILAGETFLTLSRNLNYDSGQVLQLEYEEALLREAMLDELVERILGRLMSLIADG
jgi:LPS-assembly lipoprotein